MATSFGSFDAGVDIVFVKGVLGGMLLVICLFFLEKDTKQAEKSLNEQPAANK